MSATETHEFQAEVKQVLDLMINSLYTNKDVFLRELISNSSDALDKLRYESLTDKSLLPEEELHIRLEPNEAARTLAIHDNGVGMTREEVVENLGTIARSGTKEFLKAVNERTEATTPDLIGQFGVGFYAAFIVADRITVLTRKAGEDTATKWESTGASYTIEEDKRESAGTTVLLHLKDADEEGGLQDYTQEFVLRQVIKRYSDFVAYPIKMSIKRTEVERDEEGKPKPDAKEQTVFEDQTLNSMKAIWTRPADDVSEEEHTEFYKHIAHDWNEPLKRISVRMEGTFEARALLYLPSKAPFDLYYRDMSRRGVQLYVKRVFIMDDCKDLLPNHLRFVKGVVDAEDLSLNVSREMLQQDRQIRAIRKHLVKRVYEGLGELKRDNREGYETFFRELGPALKEGLLDPSENHEGILDLILCPSTYDPKQVTSLDEYVERMKEGQEQIYFLTGASLEAVQNSPHLEAFRDKGYEVLFLIDQVDEVWGQQPIEYKGKKFQSVGKGEVELGSEEEKKEAEKQREEKAQELNAVLTAIRVHLQDDIKEVRLSNRLTSSLACLVSEEGDITPQLEAILRQSGQEIPKVKRVLELNSDHAVMEKLQALHSENSDHPALKDYAELLYGQALLAEGGQLPDPAAFSRKVADLMAKA